MKRIFMFSFLSVLTIVNVNFTTGCRNHGSGKYKEIIIFHAGSLSVPFRQIKEEYEKKNPGVSVLLEPAGSLVCARKVTELKRPCDIIASADYVVINELLIPRYATWGIRFATNEMVIAYNDRSHYASEINSDNWIEILLRDDVIYARSDPDSDPGGYRTVLSLMLAEKYYKKEGLTKQMTAKNIEYIRPKEVDLIALIESNAIDFMFQYKSVAIQHGLNFIKLPDEINLSDPSKNEIYNTVSVSITGNRPGTTLSVKGEYINYGMTVLENAPQKDAAVDFICFVLSKEGMDIFRKNGQNPIIPFYKEHPDKIPSELLDFLNEVNMN